jgi:hypothetical protein
MIIGSSVLLGVSCHAQGNLDAGRSPAQIFADSCAGCHRDARELRRSNANFLRQHYMSGSEAEKPARSTKPGRRAALVPITPFLGTKDGTVNLLTGAMTVVWPAGTGRPESVIE